jgi:hypothetical protein
LLDEGETDVTHAERTPRFQIHWSKWEPPADVRRKMADVAISFSWWRQRAILVCSALENAEAPDGRGDAIPQWHVSISKRHEPPTLKVARDVLRDFGMLDAEEDNHHPGHARHFFLPVDPSRRVDCECKATEKTIIEPDGYKWTTPVDGTCRGCELEALIGRPCSLHGVARAM